MNPSTMSHQTITDATMNASNTTRAFYDVAGELTHSDGAKLTIGERAEFVLEILRGIYRARMESAVKAGQRASAEAEMGMLTIWEGVHQRFQQELANGTPKDIAATAIFAVFNKYDEVMREGENPVRTRHGSGHP